MSMVGHDSAVKIIVSFISKITVRWNRTQRYMIYEEDSVADELKKDLKCHDRTHKIGKMQNRNQGKWLSKHYASA